MSYIYDIASNFPAGLELGQLQNAIINESAISTALEGLISDSIDLTITFVTSLTLLEQTALNNVIANYTFTAQPTLNPNGSVLNFSMTNLKYRANTISFEKISQMSWIMSKYSRFTNPSFISDFTIYDRNLEWILQDTVANITLGSGTIASSGIYAYDIALPTNNTIIELKIRKVNNGGRSPEINSSLIQLIS